MSEEALAGRDVNAKPPEYVDRRTTDFTENAMKRLSLFVLCLLFFGVMTVPPAYAEAQDNPVIPAGSCLFGPQHPDRILQVMSVLIRLLKPRHHSASTVPGEPWVRAPTGTPTRWAKPARYVRRRADPGMGRPGTDHPARGRGAVSAQRQALARRGPGYHHDASRHRRTAGRQKCDVDGTGKR